MPIAKDFMGDLIYVRIEHIFYHTPTACSLKTAIEIWSVLTSRLSREQGSPPKDFIFYVAGDHFPFIYLVRIIRPLQYRYIPKLRHSVDTTNSTIE